MKGLNIDISVFSSEDPSSIISALDQINLENYSIKYTFPASFKSKRNEIIIVQEENIDSSIYKALMGNRDDIQNKIIFVIKEKDALLASSIIKWGYYDIFVFPFEYFKMIAYLQEIILNNSYLTENNSLPATANDTDLDAIIGNSKENVKICSFLAKRVLVKDFWQKLSINMHLVGPLHL
jgi:hypothetical protein